MALPKGPGRVDSIRWQDRIEWRLEQLTNSGIPGGGGSGASQLETSLNALRDELRDHRPIVLADRSVFECLAHGIPDGELVRFAQNDRRTRLRINNNSGDGSQGLPVRNTCDLVVGYGIEHPTETEWDQIVLAGESALVDAPHLELRIGCLSPGTPLTGLFSVTEYFI